jgi:tetratricopeptide (TPR) repeat protein
MSPFEPPDSHFLNAAIGWLMLGNSVEARAEFEQIRTALREHPPVLEFEWRLLAAEKRWLDAVATGERLLRVCPDNANAWVHRSYALHELRRTREAFDLLLPAVRQFPQEIIIPYNLACYTCQLGAWPPRAAGSSKRSRSTTARRRNFTGCAPRWRIQTSENCGRNCRAGWQTWKPNPAGESETRSRGRFTRHASSV